MTCRRYAALAASAFLIATPALAQTTQPRPAAPVVLTTPNATDAKATPMPESAVKPAGKSGCNWSKRVTS